VEGDVAELRARERALVRAHGAAWTAEARPFAVGDFVKLRRGFVEHVRWDCARLITHGFGPLLKVAPLVRAIDPPRRPPAASCGAARRRS
jgi:hypothetical protein